MSHDNTREHLNVCRLLSRSSKNGHLFSCLCPQSCLLCVWTTWSDLWLWVVAGTFPRMQRLGPSWQVNAHQTSNCFHSVSDWLFIGLWLCFPGWSGTSRGSCQAARRRVPASPSSHFWCKDNSSQLCSKHTYTHTERQRVSDCIVFVL